MHHTRGAYLSGGFLGRRESIGDVGNDWKYTHNEDALWEVVK